MFRQIGSKFGYAEVRSVQLRPVQISVFLGSFHRASELQNAAKYSGPGCPAGSVIMACSLPRSFIVRFAMQFRKYVLTIGIKRFVTTYL